MRGDEITVTTAHDKQTGTYKVVREDKAQVTIVTDKDEPNDAQTFTLVDDKTLRWGVLDGQRQLIGRPLNVPDGQIAATALEHGLTVVTRNGKDFTGLGVALLNPWDAV